jgi:hypothetical protein
MLGPEVCSALIRVSHERLAAQGRLEAYNWLALTHPALMLQDVLVEKPAKSPLKAHEVPANLLSYNRKC